WGVPARETVSRRGASDKFRPRDPGVEVSALLDVDVVVACAMEDERRDLDGGEDAANVDVRVHAQQRRGRAGARAAPEVLLEVPHELGVADAARRVVLDVLRPEVAPVALDLFRRLLAVLG